MNKSNASISISEEVIKIDEAKKSSIGNVVHLKGSIGNNLSFQDNVEVCEDVFGVYYDAKGEAHNIKRFTLKNKNKIQVQVINYGARVASIKMPDRRGHVDDIVLGFDDVAGYKHYKNYYIGATIGRTTNLVRNSTFQIDNKQHWLTPNLEPHHYNGGRVGFDQVVWTTFLDEKKVIMSHISPHMSEGYPGDLLVRVIFELSEHNEFSIKMEAQCTRPTIVNLSNLTYFNLAGHHSGSNEIYRHIVTLNCNCFTIQADNGMPTGEIMNVAHSGFDFQVPKLLGKLMGIVPKDGFNQNLCVNRGLGQGDCFVGRVLHPPSGRLIELYSNQWGVNFSTANDFGNDRLLSMEQILKAPPPTAIETKRKCVGSEPLLRLYAKVHEQIKDTLSKDEENTYKEIYELINRIKHYSSVECPNTPVNTPEVAADGSNLEEAATQQRMSIMPSDVRFTPLQIEYLNKIHKVLCDNCDEEACEDLKEVITIIISLATSQSKEDESVEEKSIQEEVLEKQLSPTTPPKLTERKSPVTSSGTSKSKKTPVKQNLIPDYYKSSNQIIGKDRAHYTSHGGIALQTQNYPACVNFKNFPNCVLKPGETYTHTITYKFWIKAGNPNKWIKKNLNESRSILK
ncbi:hypothetical protein NQ315_016010 [Exocentrus adspersus]|uniref:Galactose mutarotase n=1 Tax=Exocentrus adspersus TaxID=1586481 RepID=A0AAV8VMG2_9CUCU|nr:hypothetical protein NQ315_016010 [Exocentrus adspersus]